MTIECLFQTTYNLQLLEEALMPVSALDLGGSLQTILGLQKKWNEMKPWLQVKKQTDGLGWTGKKPKTVCLSLPN